MARARRTPTTGVVPHMVASIPAHAPRLGTLELAHPTAAAGVAAARQTSVALMHLLLVPEHLPGALPQCLATAHRPGLLVLRHSAVAKIHAATMPQRPEEITLRQPRVRMRPLLPVRPHLHLVAGRIMRQRLEHSMHQHLVARRPRRGFMGTETTEDQGMMRGHQVRKLRSIDRMDEIEALGFWGFACFTITLISAGIGCFFRFNIPKLLICTLLHYILQHLQQYAAHFSGVPTTEL